MALTISSDLCTGCAACEDECPNSAVHMKRGMYLIDPDKCTECSGKFDQPQCQAVCPMTGCISKAG
ncbi:4Fe-4S binding protein [Paludibacterium yongneupense]|uniref:4Fe-4S binding protein n=1 Tax=Paludibacterium yongneupense TaxID=400061 RepID=UPI000427F31D|nr:4Fe-4S binding protein [Paludibacterium yongneupense]